jgi:MOSC domain-containing protein YiiM
LVARLEEPSPPALSLEYKGEGATVRSHAPVCFFPLLSASFIGMSITLVSIQVGLPKSYGVEGAADPMDQPWRSGFFKSPIAGPVHVGKTNLAGDGQADLKHHGGVDKAILCYSADHYPYWRENLKMPDLPYGAFGENLTLAGVDEAAIFIGDAWQIADVQLEVSQPRQPCWKIGRRWRIKDMPDRVIANGKSGWYTRVLREGTIEPGREMTLVHRRQTKWSIARANHLLFHDLQNLAAAEEMAQMDFLAESWRKYFAGLLGRTIA